MSDELAEMMAKYCVLFLAYHEFAHIISGHLDLLMPAGASFFSMDEGLENLPEQDDALSRRNVELDADAFAAVQLQIHIDKEEIWPKEGLAMFIFANHFQRVRVLCLTIYLLFRSLERARMDASDLSRRSHPGAAFRSQFAANSIMEYNCRVSSRPYEDFIADFIMPVAEAVEELFAFHAYDSVFRRALYTYFDGKEFGRVMSRWAKLRPKLDQLKLSPAINLAAVQAEPG